MAETYGFYNNVSGDREYQDEALAAPFGAIVGTAGVVAGTDDELEPHAGSGLQVIIDSGFAFGGHTPGWWYQSTEEITKTLDAAETGYKRIDEIVLRFDRNLTSRSASIEVIKGEEVAGTPIAPATTQNETVYELLLCQVSIEEATLVSLTDERMFTNLSQTGKDVERMQPLVDKHERQTEQGMLLDAEFALRFKMMGEAVVADGAYGIDFDDEVELNASEKKFQQNLTASVTAGDNVLTVADTTGLAVGNNLTIAKDDGGASTEREYGTIASLTATTITLNDNLVNDYSTVDISIAYLSGAGQSTGEASSLAYASLTKSLGQTVRDVCWSGNGLYLFGVTTDTIYRWTTTSPYDEQNLVSSQSRYLGVSDLSSIYITKDGLHIVVTTCPSTPAISYTKLRRYTCGAANDMSSGAGWVSLTSVSHYYTDQRPAGIWSNEEGTVTLTYGDQLEKIIKWTAGGWGGSPSVSQSMSVASYVSTSGTGLEVLNDRFIYIVDAGTAEMIMFPLTADLNLSTWDGSAHTDFSISNVSSIDGATFSTANGIDGYLHVTNGSTVYKYEVIFDGLSHKTYDVRVPIETRDNDKDWASIVIASETETPFENVEVAFSFHDDTEDDNFIAATEHEDDEYVNDGYKYQRFTYLAPTAKEQVVARITYTKASATDLVEVKELFGGIA